MTTTLQHRPKSNKVRGIINRSTKHKLRKFLAKKNLNLKQKILQENHSLTNFPLNDFGFEMEYTKKFLRLYIKKLDFKTVSSKTRAFAKFIRANYEEIASVLLRYETYEVVRDEIARTLDLLESLKENEKYFQREIGSVATFLPSNQPLYALTCFAIIPSLMAKDVYIKEPVTMSHFFFDLIKVIKLSNFFTNVYVSKQTREEFVSERAALASNPSSSLKEPLTDVVIFTGSQENADKLRQIFPMRTLFIANGSGHNPFVVTEMADVGKAVSDAVDVQLYNQGQDCSAPNAILVHSKIYSRFVSTLRRKLKEVKIGSYSNRENRVGPISRRKDLERIQRVLIQNSFWLDEAAPGVIRSKLCIVEPTIILKPLKEGGNYDETFAPIFFVQKYDNDADLSHYFENSEYELNAMFIALYGQSPYIQSLVNRPFSNGRILHPPSTIIRNSNSHVSGFERGTQEYGGYGRGTSSVGIYGKLIPKPTLPQRDIFAYLVYPSLCLEIALKKAKGKNLQKAVGKQFSKSFATKKYNFKGLSQDKSGISANWLSASSKHWSENIAKKITASPLGILPTCSLIVAPAHVIDITTLRGLLVSYAVNQVLIKQNKKAKLMIYWNDLEVMKRLPSGLHSSFENFLDKPLLSLPDPLGEYNTYSDRLRKSFQAITAELGIEYELHKQSDLYKRGLFDEFIHTSLVLRREIASVVFHLHPSQRLGMPKRLFCENYFPIEVCSRFTGKYNTEIMDYDDVRLMYRCLDTGNIETIDFTKDRRVKLKPILERIARWQMESIAFEVSSENEGETNRAATGIALEIFKQNLPIQMHCAGIVFQGIDRLKLEFASFPTLDSILQIYEPNVLKWLCLHFSPVESFHLSFNEEVFRHYEEFNRRVKDFNAGKLEKSDKSELEIISSSQEVLFEDPISFGQFVALGQIVSWDSRKLIQLLAELGVSYEFASFRSRLKSAKLWLDYNFEKRICLRKNPNIEYLSKLTQSASLRIKKLSELLQNSALSLKEMEQVIYEIPKEKDLSANENKIKQREFFQDVYRLLLDADTGPRLATFLWASDKSRVLPLLDIHQKY